MGEELQESLCWTCKRAYAMPYEVGGCEKFLYGKAVYNHAIFTHYTDVNVKGKLTHISVIDCDLYEKEGGETIERCEKVPLNSESIGISM